MINKPKIITNSVVLDNKGLISSKDIIIDGCIILLVIGWINNKLKSIK